MQALKREPVAPQAFLPEGEENESYIIEPFLRLRNNVSRTTRRFPANFSFLVVVAAVIIGILVSQQMRGRSGAFQPVFIASSTEMLLPELDRNEPSTLTQKIRRGHSLENILGSYGFPEKTRNLVSESLKGFSQKDEFIRPGSRVQVALDQNGALGRIKVFFEPTQQLVLEMREEKFSPWILRQTPIMQEQLVVGEIKSSFAASAVKAGLPYELMDDLVDLFSERVEFSKDFRSGDRFTVLLRNQIAADGSQKGTAVILAAALEVDDETFIAARFVGSDGKPRYFDEKGTQIGATFLRYPLQFSRISSAFSDARFHPVLGRKRPHNGVDFAAPVGTPVRSVAEGRVVFAGYRGPAGKMVRIRHSDRYTTEYFHLSGIQPGISKGRLVRIGEIIGAVGSTGLSTGPHLHYGLFDFGRYVNPLSAKLPVADKLRPGQSVSRHYLGRVLFTLRSYQTMSLAG